MFFKDLQEIEARRRRIIARIDDAGVAGKPQDELTDLMSATDLARMVADGVLVRKGARYWTPKTSVRAGHRKIYSLEKQYADILSPEVANSEDTEQQPDGFPGIPW